MADEATEKNGGQQGEQQDAIKKVAPGKLVIFSGPSGVGKSTIVNQVLGYFTKHLRLSVSATTRPPRPGEQDGVHYHFLSDEQFSERREQDEFVECIEVFGHGHWYGTLWSEVRPFLAAGKWVLLEIDVDGAEKILRQTAAGVDANETVSAEAATASPDAMESVSIFLRPVSFETLEQRLRNRGTETEASIQRRLSVARHELAMADRYEHQVVNDTVEKAVDEICQILQAQGLAHD